jgi:hypothetical protein
MQLQCKWSQTLIHQSGCLISNARPSICLSDLLSAHSTSCIDLLHLCSIVAVRSPLYVTSGDQHKHVIPYICWGLYGDESLILGFWFMAICSNVNGYQCFEGSCWSRVKGISTIPTLKMETNSLSKTLEVNWWHNPEHHYQTLFPPFGYFLSCI